MEFLMEGSGEMDQVEAKDKGWWWWSYRSGKCIIVAVYD